MEKRPPYRWSGSPAITSVFRLQALVPGRVGVGVSLSSDEFPLCVFADTGGSGRGRRRLWVGQTGEGTREACPGPSQGPPFSFHCFRQERVRVPCSLWVSVG